MSHATVGSPIKKPYPSVLGFPKSMPISKLFTGATIHPKISEGRFFCPKEKSFRTAGPTKTTAPPIHIEKTSHKKMKSMNDDFVRASPVGKAILEARKDPTPAAI